MKRNYCAMMLVFSSLLLVGIGCRRVGEPQKALVAIEKEDFIQFRNDDLLKVLRPPKKPVKYPIALTTPIQHPEISKDSFLPDVEVVWTPSPDDSDAGKKVQEDRRAAFAKLKDKYFQDVHVSEMGDLTKSYVAFVKGTGIADRHFEGVKTWLRRTKKIDMRLQIDGKEVEVILDSDLAVKSHLIAYRAKEDLDGHVTVTAEEKVVFRKLEDIQMAVKHQQLWLLWKAYLEYSTKTPKNQLDDAGFKRYMKGNMVPSTWELVRGKKIAVVVEVEPDGNQVFAWYTDEEGYAPTPDDKRVGFFQTAPGEKVSGGAQVPPPLKPRYFEKDKEALYLLDAAQTQQLQYTWKARNGYFNSLNRPSPQPPLPREYNGLRAYLKANTFLSINTLIEEGKLLLSDPAVAHPFVACFSDPLQTKIVDEKQPPPPVLHRAVAADGQVSLIPAATVPLVFTKK